MRSAKPGLIGLGLLLSGCSLAPTYQRPAVATPPSFREVPAGWAVAQPAAALPKGSWWTGFSDPTLSALEDRIEQNSPTLAIAVARYDQARGAVREAQSELMPQVGVDASASRERASANRPLNLTGKSATYNDYQGGASLSLELDIFGRIRNSIKAGRAEADASQADVAAVRLGLQASLAGAYFRLRGLDARAALLRQTVDAFTRALDLTNKRHRGGIASGLDANRAQTQLSSARSELAGIRPQRAALEHAIAVLVGESASTFTIAEDERIVAPPNLGAGTPSALLQRRPDIDAAERRVFAANARIGVAKAALFPTITLGGGIGFQTTGPNPISASSTFWALGPAALAASIFDGGARSARVRISRAEFTEAAARYKETVLTAFKEVEDDLAAGRDITDQIREQQDAADAAGRTRDLALKRYRDGAADYLEVVTAQTAALDASRQLLDLQTQRLAIAVDTVRALGGAVR